MTEQRLRALLHATQVVAGQLELPVVLQRIAETAVQLVDAEHGAIGVISPEGGLEQFITVGIDEATRAAIGHPPTGRGLLGALIDDPRAVRLARLSDDPRSSGFPPGHPPMGSFLGVPIRVGDAVFGNLYLTDRRGGRFSAEDEDLVEALAATAGTAIENARLFESARRREQWTAASAEVSETILAAGREPGVSMLEGHVARLARASVVKLVTRDGDGDGDSNGDGGSGMRGGAADDVLATGAPQQLVREGRSVLALPLSASGSTWGALVIERDAALPRFSPEEVEVAADLVARAAVAFELSDAREDHHRVELLEDRGRISRDLHDHVVQQLFGTGLQLQSLVRRLGRGEGSDTEATADAVSDAVSRIDESIAQIRTVIFALDPGDDGEAPSARRRLLDLVDEAAAPLVRRPAVSFSGPVDLVVTGSLVDDVIAVVREALTNVVRHAEATRVSLGVAAADGAVTVVVRDDGIGIPDDGRRSGLRNLRERARARGGSLVVDSSPGSTVVRWSVPYPEEAGGAQPGTGGAQPGAGGAQAGTAQPAAAQPGAGRASAGEEPR
ncbi:GAF domain-containing protein [Herbiconiux sp. KACC 21604]|uniref:sensor histidine kinase n=1 Tax=unclassified Herbiconiux TaxID=2618217 RepID=UPI001491902B|nr:GAF domain-containing protein [Herbiconiux sp. SALV-R1]QJU52345.1 GAF domain-containing protein [Herbiconiux sp. SALV-R1]WPO87201.1 GAF domain-containing protein [Herbiconiux sp. KACC 21604]